VDSVVIGEEAHSPVGRGALGRGTLGGGVSGLHAVDLLPQVLGALVVRTGIDPVRVEDMPSVTIDVAGIVGHRPPRGEGGRSRVSANSVGRVDKCSPHRRNVPEPRG
jgi:hypothetical protein